MSHHFFPSQLQFFPDFAANPEADVAAVLRASHLSAGEEREVQHLRQLDLKRRKRKRKRKWTKWSRRK